MIRNSASLSSAKPNLSLIGYDNVIAAADISAQSENGSYPATNMANPRTDQRWAADTSGAQTITLTVGASVDYVAIARHNLGTSGMSVTLEGNTTAGGAFSELVAEFTPSNDDVLIMRFVKQTLAEVRISLGAGTQEPTIAVLYCGALLVMERGLATRDDNTPINWGRVTDTVSGRSESGQFLGRIVKGQWFEGAADFDLTPSVFADDVNDFIIAAQDDPFFIALQPEDYPSEVGFVWLMNDPQPVRHLGADLDRLHLEFQGFAGETGINANPVSYQTLSAAIIAAGQSSDLSLCLDAGDTNSFNVTGGKWEDVSGSSNDFDLGTDDETDETADPTFNGPAGALNPSAYWSFPDGPDDAFRLSAASNPTFIEDMHKNNAAFTVLIVVRLADVSTLQHLFATSNEGGETGIRLYVNAGAFGIAVDNGGSPSAFSNDSLRDLTADEYAILGLSIDEAGGANASWAFKDGSFSTFDGAYSSPASGDATSLAHIVNRPNRDLGILSDSRLAAMAIWDRALTTTEFQSVYDLISGRFGS